MRERMIELRLKLTRLFIRQVSEGEQIPWGWGVAWHRPLSFHSVAMPIPIGFAVRVFLWLYYGVANRWLSTNAKDRWVVDAIRGGRLRQAVNAETLAVAIGGEPPAADPPVRVRQSMFALLVLIVALFGVLFALWTLYGQWEKP